MSQSFAFSCFQYQGQDVESFLQGQVTINLTKLDADHYYPSAICDLKGRVHFGLWLRRHAADQIDVVISQDLAEEFKAHIKKFSAFSKVTLNAETAIYAALIENQARFSLDSDQAADPTIWQQTAIKNGEAWINQLTSHLFQPQELRLHQRGGVDYDKGCYLGQEIVARLWFKAKPKQWLHLIQGTDQLPVDGSDLAKNVHVVNAVKTDQGWIGLVIAKPETLLDIGVEILDLPAAINGSVARQA